MPSLPVYNSQNNVVARTQQPLRQEAAKTFEANAMVIDTLAGVNSKLAQANDVMQETEARTTYNRKALDIQSRALADPDFRNVDKYTKELDQAKAEAVNLINNQQTAGRISLEMDLDKEVAALKIKQSAFTKYAEFTKSQVRDNLDIEYTRMFNSSPTEQAAKIQKLNEDLYKQEQAGIMTRNDIVKSVVSAQETSALQGMFVDPDKTIQYLEAKDENGTPSGIYAALPIKKRMDLIDKAKNFKKKRQLEQTELQKEASFNAKANLIIDIAKTGIIPDAKMLADMSRRGLIDDDFAEAALSAATNPISVDAGTEEGVFSEYTKEILKSGDKDALQKALTNILKGGGDGKISKSDMQILVQSAIGQQKERREDIIKTVDSLVNYSQETKLPTDKILREFQKNVQDGKDINYSADAAKRKAILDTIEGAANLDDVPNMIVGKDKKTRFIFNKNTKVAAHRIYQNDKKEAK